MRKVIVFDCGFGGEVFADMIEEELVVVEVRRVIEAAGQDESEIRRLAERALAPYIGRVDVIVLASYETTMAALKHLRIRYPEQKFIGVSWPILPVNEPMVVVTTELVRRSWGFRRLMRRWPGPVAVQTCDGWLEMAQGGRVSEQKIKRKVKRTHELRPKNVVVGCVELLAYKGEIEKIYRGAKIWDGTRLTLKNLCRVLKLKDEVRIR